MRISAIFLFLLFFWIGAAVEAEAQRTPSDPNAIFGGHPSSRDPQAERAEVKGAKKSKKSSYTKSFNKQLDQKQQEFEQRMKANAKKYRKMEKEMKKPQYSDPLYFGHKRKPKKRPPGKQKFCKECGMKH